MACLQALQAGFQTGVVEPGADAHHEAPEQARLDSVLDIDGTVAGLDQPGAELLALDVGERMRRLRPGPRRRPAWPRPRRRRRPRYGPARRGGGCSPPRLRSPAPACRNPPAPAPRGAAARAWLRRSAGSRAGGGSPGSRRSAVPGSPSRRRSGPAHWSRRPAHTAQSHSVRRRRRRGVVVPEATLRSCQSRSSRRGYRAARRLAWGAECGNL